METTLPVNMHHQPRVTVIISCYNHAQYIEACIRSVLEQSYPNIELLVYDDGSRDDSVAVIRKLADEFGFFFQPQANQGLANTLNAALQRASGGLVADRDRHPHVPGVYCRNGAWPPIAHPLQLPKRGSPTRA